MNKNRNIDSIWEEDVKKSRRGVDKCSEGMNNVQTITNLLNAERKERKTAENRIKK